MQNIWKEETNNLARERGLDMIFKKRMKDINLYKIYVFIFAKERELKSDRISWIFFFWEKFLEWEKKKKAT